MYEPLLNMAKDKVLLLWKPYKLYGIFPFDASDFTPCVPFRITVCYNDIKAILHLCVSENNENYGQSGLARQTFIQNMNTVLPSFVH